MKLNKFTLKKIRPLVCFVQVMTMKLRKTGKQNTSRKSAVNLTIIFMIVKLRTK